MERPEAPLLVIRTAIQHEENNILLIRRHGGSAYNADLLEFPGGQVNTGEKIEEAQIREVYEETGYLIKPTSSPLLVGNRHIMEGEYAGRMYMMLCGPGEVIDGELSLSQEHTEAMWVPPALETAPSWQLTRETLEAARALGNLSLLRKS